MQANLTYYIFEGLLVGTAGSRMFHISARSGGGGGSTKRAFSDAVNNPYMEGLKTTGAAKSPAHVHGGPIPPGKYKICSPARHPHLGLSARLEHPIFRPMGRDGFFIHSTGPHGSDGCIVPLDHGEFQNLMKTLSETHGGVLFVLESTNDTRFA